MRKLADNRFSSLRDLAEFLAHASACGNPMTEQALLPLLASELEGQTQSVRATYQACLGRLPELEIGARHYESTRHAAEHILNSLNSPEFFSACPILVAGEFPKSPRVIFLHIPKTAGSELERRISAADAFYWLFSWCNEYWYRYEHKDAYVLKALARHVADPSRPIVLAGHQPVPFIINSGLLRACDRLFTVVRDPRDITVSAINYAFTTMIKYPTREDGRGFAQIVRSSGFAPPILVADVSPAMVDALVHSPRFVAENSTLLSRYISETGVASGALNTIARTQMEIVDISGLDNYCKVDLGIISTGRTNVSVKIVESFASLSSSVRAFILNEIVGPDLALYVALRGCMGPDGVLRPGRDLS